MKSGPPYYHSRTVARVGMNFQHLLQKEVLITLTHIISKCFSEGVFSSELKLAKVVPIFKAGASNEITNYRPISVLSFFSKVFEKIIYNHLIDFMDHNNILYGYQFGFRKGYSTQQAIITLVNKIISCLDNGDLVIGVFFLP